MFSREKLTEIIENGETSRVEFKSEREKNIDFAKEIAAFANGSGGYLLVGVEDDGRERYYTRRGTRIQEAGRDELLRLFQTSGQIHYEVTPIIKGRYADLDFARIVDFFRHNQINKIDISG